MVFSDGNRFIFNKYINHGNKTHILDTNRGALRLMRFITNSTEQEKISRPDNRKDLVGFQIWQDRYHFMREFVEGFNALKFYDIQQVKLLSSSVYNGEYILVENLNMAFTLKEFLQAHMKGEIQPTVLTKKLWEELETFLLSSWQFSFIGDFRLDQVGWTRNGKKQWKLFDMSNEVEIFSEVGDASLVDKIAEDLPMDFVSRVKRKIFDLRKQELLKEGSRFNCPLLF